MKKKILVFGVLYNTLKPSLHCQRAAVRATQVLGLIRRSFKIKSINTLVFLYKMYVQPHLEYCVQVWNPYLARDIDILEKVQRRATKYKGISSY